MLCEYGCSKEAKFQLKNGKQCCSKRPAGCDVLKKINSEGGRRSYASGKRKTIVHRNLPQSSRDRLAWARGLTANTDPRIKAMADAQRGKPKTFSKPMSQEGRDNISKARVNIILEGKYDTSGRKGHRGYYEGIYFHSSWELAYYVFQKEKTDSKIKKNTKIVLEYYFEGRVRRYIPDFIVNEKIIEIKSYLYGERDHAKYEQTKDRVEYKFKKDLKKELEYCKEKYGPKFWERLYSKGN